MSDRSWKQMERRSAALLGGRRFWANSGATVDVESDGYVAQCKEVSRLSLAALEALALEAERQGSQRQKVGLVLVKRRAGRGRATPRLLVLTEAAWRFMNGSLPVPEEESAP
jgi:hypothetical protein